MGRFPNSKKKYIDYLLENKINKLTTVMMYKTSAIENKRTNNTSYKTSTSTGL